MGNLSILIVAVILGAISFSGFRSSAQDTVDTVLVERHIQREEAIIDQIRRFQGNTGAYPASVADLVGAGYLRNSDTDNGFGGAYAFTVDAAKGTVAITTTIADDARRAKSLTFYKNKWAPVDQGGGVLTTTAILPSNAASAMANPGAQVQAATSATAPDAATNSYWWDTSGSQAVLKVSNGSAWAATSTGSGSGSSSGSSGAVNVVAGGMTNLASNLTAGGTGSNGDMKNVADATTGIISTYVFYNGAWYLYGAASSAAVVSKNLTLSVSSLDFGSKPKNSTTDMVVTVTNPNAIPVTSAVASTTGAKFSVSTDTCGATVPAYSSCSLTIRLAASTTTGSATGTLSYANTIVSLAAVVVPSSTMVSKFNRNTDALYGPRVVAASNGQIYTVIGVGSRFALSSLSALNAINWTKGGAGLTNPNYMGVPIVDGAGRVLMPFSNGGVYGVFAFDAAGTGLWAHSIAAIGGGLNIVNFGNGSISPVATDANSFFAGGNSGAICYVYKISSVNGTVTWRSSLSSSSSCSIYGVKGTADGGVVVVGARNSGSDMGFVAKLNNDGTLAWQKDVTGATTSTALTSVGVDAGGNVYVAGYAVSSSFSTRVLLKLSPTGSLSWYQRYETGAAFASLAVSGERVFVGYGTRVLSFSTTDGSVVWAKTSPVMNAYSLAIDSNDSVVVGGGAVPATSVYITRLTSDLGGVSGSYLSGAAVVSDYSVPAAGFAFVPVVNPGGSAFAAGTVTIANAALTTTNDAALVVTTENNGF